jgi:hypothetical protein
MSRSWLRALPHKRVWGEGQKRTAPALFDRFFTTGEQREHFDDPSCQDGSPSPLR